MKRLVKIEEERLGRIICGAWKPQKKGVCCRRPIDGRNRCRWDGGSTPRGEASPHYKGKGYSASLPTRYRDKHHDLMSKPEAVEMFQDIVLAHQRVQELLESLDVEGSFQHWKAINEMLSIAIGVSIKEKTPIPVEFLERLREVVHEGLADYSKHQDIQQAQNHKRDLLLADAKLHKEAGTTINFNQYNLMMDHTTNVLVSEIHDRKLLDRILSKLIQ